MSDPVLAAREVIAGYHDRRVLHGVSIDSFDGDRILIAGANGSGKSTLLKVLAGVLGVSGGHVLLHGTDVSRLPVQQRAHRGIAYLPQVRNVFPSLTIADNLRLALCRPKAVDEERLSIVMDAFPALEVNYRKRAGLLSGGERQALAIAMTLVRPAGILLLDEPTAGLSPAAATGILEALKAVHAEMPLTTLLVEHNVRLAQTFVTRAVVMSQGRIVAEEQDPASLDGSLIAEYYFR